MPIKKKQPADSAEAKRGPRGSPNENIPPSEKKLVKSLLKQIQDRFSAKDYDTYHKNIKKWRMYARGRQYEDEAEEKTKLVRANLIYSTLAAAIPRIYARNPEIEVSPTEAVEPQRYTVIRNFCRTLQIVLNDQFSPVVGNLKAKAKANIMATQTSAMGWLKVIYQKDIRKDPIIETRMNDTQDNILKIESLLKDVKDEQKREEKQKNLELLKHQLDDLKAKVEVTHYEGLAIDRVLSENIVISGEVREPSAYRDADWLAERIYKPKSWSKTMFGFAPEGATIYSKKDEPYQAERSKLGIGDQKDGELCFYELWDITSNTVYTLCEGYNGYMREPYHPTKLGQRWYPYFMLCFNPVDGTLHPLSDVELLTELQDEYNTTRTNLAEHRKWSIPHWVGMRDSLTKKDVKAIKDAQAFEMVLIDGDPSKPLKNYLDVFSNPAIDPRVYDVQPIRVDWELVSGQPDSTRGNVGRAKTLGEAEFLQQGMATRMDERIDTNEDFLQEIARYTAEILLQELTPAQVQRIVGPGAVWPQLTKEENFAMVQIQIRAGSTGKPDKRYEQEVWMKLLPLMKDLIMAVFQMRAANQEDTAKSLIKLAQETFRRFDERIDVESFFPTDKPGQVDPKKAMAMMQQMALAKLQMQKLVEEVNVLRSTAAKNLATAEKDSVEAKFGSVMQMLELLDQSLTSGALAPPQPAQPPAGGEGAAPPGTPLQ